MPLRLIRQRLKRERFLPSRLSIVISPIYIIRRALYRQIADLAPRVTGATLDFGCGSKPYETLFTKATRYIGVDIRQSGHDHQTSKIDVFYDGKSLPFAGESFDSVVCFEVFEHVFNIRDVLDEINRTLKPNAVALFTLPFAWDEHEAPYDFARYTSFGVRHLLEQSGFEVLELRKSTTYFLAACQMLIAYFSQHVSPRNKVIRSLIQLVFIFPLNVLTLLLNEILPKRYDYFCNLIVLAKKNAPHTTARRTLSASS